MSWRRCVLSAHFFTWNYLPHNYYLCFPKLHNLGFVQVYSSTSWKDDSELHLKPSKDATDKITSPFYHKVKRYKNIVQDLEAPIRDRLRKGHRKIGIKNNQQQRGSVHVDSKPAKRPKPDGQVMYGKYPVYIALQAKKRHFHRIILKANSNEEVAENSNDLIKGIIRMGRELKVPIKLAPRRVLDELVCDPIQGVRQHQGVCADVSPLKYLQFNADELSIGDRNPDRDIPQDPNNFGAILRSAYYLGVDKVIAHNSCKLSPAVSKVSAGAVEIQDVYRTDNLPQLLLMCRDHGWKVYGTTGLSPGHNGGLPLHQVAVSNNTIIILGNEGVGMSDDVASLCDAMITIAPNTRPSSSDQGVHEALDSLNVSVASGIILHHLLTKRSSS